MTNALRILYWKTRGAIIGKGCRIASGARLSSHVTLRDRCEIGPGAMLLSYGGWIRMGERSSLNAYCVAYGHGGLWIGSGVRVGAHTVFIPANHALDGTGWIADNPITRRGVFVDDGAWIGANVLVLDGVRIGAGASIGGGAVVTRDIPPLAIAFGNPARVRGYRT